MPINDVLRLDEPPHAPRNCGDCGGKPAPLNSPVLIRLTLLGIAATAAERVSPQGVVVLAASRSSELRRLRPELNHTLVDGFCRLTLLGIAATAAGDFGVVVTDENAASRSSELRRLRH